MICGFNQREITQFLNSVSWKVLNTFSKEFPFIKNWNLDTKLLKLFNLDTTKFCNFSWCVRSKLFLIMYFFFFRFFNSAIMERSPRLGKKSWPYQRKYCIRRISRLGSWIHIGSWISNFGNYFEKGYFIPGLG